LGLVPTIEKFCIDCDLVDIPTDLHAL
jgi:hypothetical protein